MVMIDVSNSKVGYFATQTTLDKVRDVSRAVSKLILERHGLTHRYIETPDDSLPYLIRRRYFEHVPNEEDRMTADYLDRRATRYYAKIADLLLAEPKSKSHQVCT
jgi:hypothetical protein